jgi:hypothetical protein
MFSSLDTVCRWGLRCRCCSCHPDSSQRQMLHSSVSLLCFCFSAGNKFSFFRCFTENHGAHCLNGVKEGGGGVSHLFRPPRRVILALESMSAAAAVLLLERCQHHIENCAEARLTNRPLLCSLFGPGGKLFLCTSTPTNIKVYRYIFKQWSASKKLATPQLNSGNGPNIEERMPFSLRYLDFSFTYPDRPKRLKRKSLVTKPRT